MLPEKVSLTEVGPREGFQFEGAGQPERISLAQKLQLIDALAHTGAKILEIVSFVHPRIVPQMADAEEICRQVIRRPGIDYTGIYLNETGLRRALATGVLTVNGELMLSASETFALRNQKRTFEQEIEAQRHLAAAYRQHGIAVCTGSVMAAFGCNFEGEVPLARVLGLIGRFQEVIAESAAGTLRRVKLADTMGWADPEQIRRTVGSIRERWPDLEVALHLHDTRGLAVANVYAALLEGVDQFDTAVGGLGGCPFASHPGAAGNVATEQVVFLCQQLGIDSGFDLSALLECARLAESIIGHGLPGRLIGMKPDALRRNARPKAHGGPAATAPATPKI